MKATIEIVIDTDCEKGHRLTVAEELSINDLSFALLTSMLVAEQAAIQVLKNAGCSDDEIAAFRAFYLGEKKK